MIFGGGIFAMRDFQENNYNDTKLLYPSVNSPELEEDFSKAQECINRFRAKYYGNISSLDAGELGNSFCRPGVGPRNHYQTTSVCLS